MATGTPPILHYAPQPRGRRRRRLVILLLAVSTAAILLSPWWGPPLRRQYDRYIVRRQAREYLRQCLRYSAPPDQVIYEEDPLEMAKLLGAGSLYRRDSFGRQAVILQPALWPGGYQHSSTGIAFLHQRRSSAGQVRLVEVDFDGRDDRNGMFFLPGAFSTDKSHPLAPVTIWDGKKIDFPAPPLRLFAGQSDPVDLSHFTIGYQSSGTTGIIDGWLGDDDTIKLQVRGR
ncbi:MAG TPA: hypothetical protein VIL86_02770 [Tepidisphaeraceae bacterium]